jgi:hypothetical protein
MTSTRSLGRAAAAPATLAERLGSSRPPTSWSISATGRARPPRTQAAHGGPRHGRGRDCIDDVELLRCGSTASVLGHRVMAASTVGTWLRSFAFGRVRQLDKVTGEVLARAWAAGAGPGDGPLTVAVDSTICEVGGDHQQGACYGYPAGWATPLLAFRGRQRRVLHARRRRGAANTARGITGVAPGLWTP